METTEIKTIIVNNPGNLPTISFKELKEKYEANALKQKKDREVGDLKASILALGFSIPLFIWEKGKYLADGSGRLLALEMLEYEGYTIPDVPYVPLKADSKKEAKRLTLVISSQYGLITPESISEFMLDMNEIDLGFVNIEGINLDDVDWKPGKKEYEIEEDEAPEAPAEPKSKLGDMYQLGRHRLIVGDATDMATIGALMDGVKADLYLSDAPYNVAYVGKTKDALTIQNDKMSDDKFREFLRSAFLTADKHLKEGGAFYLWHADSEGFNFRGACHDIGWKIRECLIWVKNSLVLGRQDYHWKHEPCLYGWKEGAGHVWNSDRKQTTVLEFDRPSRSTDHPTMKPVKLFAYQIQNNTVEGQIVLDTFLGSGTSIVSAEQTGRTCYGSEIDPRYADVCVSRYCALTGKNEIIKNGKKIKWVV